MELMEKYIELYRNYLNIKESVSEQEYSVVYKEGNNYGQHEESGRNNTQTRRRDK